MILSTLIQIAFKASIGTALMFSINLSLSHAATNVTQPPAHQLFCDTYGKVKTPTITASLDGVFKQSGSKVTTVFVNGKPTPGHISTQDGHDSNFRGLKFVKVHFGNQMSIQATLSPAFYMEGPLRVEGEGYAILLQYDQNEKGQLYCKILSTCTTDPRLCPN